MGPTGGTKLSLQLHKTNWHESAPILVDMLQYAFPLWIILTSCVWICISNHIHYFVLQYAGSLGLVYISATFAGKLYTDLSTAKSLEPVPV